jgi:TalC/MipB family fructose-6-phosphate aldolase
LNGANGSNKDLYLDTADRQAAEELLATGLFKGVTTNPTILQRASRTVADIPDIYAWATKAGAARVFFQAWGRDTDTLVERGRSLRSLGDEVVVKLVASQAGTAACAQLAAEGVPTLLTAVYDPAQAVVAAAAGATYIAPYLRRLSAAGRDGLADIATMHRVLATTQGRTRVLVASIPDVSSVVELATLGLDSFTMAPSIAEQFFTDELTAEAVETFEEAVTSGSRRI